MLLYIFLFIGLILGIDDLIEDIKKWKRIKKGDIREDDFVVK